MTVSTTGHGSSGRIVAAGIGLLLGIHGILVHTWGKWIPITLAFTSLLVFLLARRANYWLFALATSCLLSAAMIPSIQWHGSWISAGASAAMFFPLGAAALWASGEQTRHHALLITKCAGLVTATGVLAERFTGHVFMPINSRYVETTLVAGALRPAGFQTSPNEAAIILSLAGVVLAYELTRRPLPSSMALGSLILVALFLTSSRASLLAFVVAATLVAILSGSPDSSARSLPRRLALLAIGFGFLILGTAASVSTGRSLNPFAATDPSARYRKKMQAFLFSEVDWAAFTGIGFLQGNEISPNTLLVGSDNIDNSLLYVVITLGIAGGVSILILLLAVSLSVSRRRPAVLVLAGWIAVIGAAENLFSLTPAMVLIPLAIRILGGEGENAERASRGGVEQHAMAASHHDK